MRVSRGKNTALSSSPTHSLSCSPPILADEHTATDPGIDNRILSKLARIADSLDRLADGIEKQNEALGDGKGTRYTRSPGASDLVDEKTMAGILGISLRTLGNYRRQGRFPNCWIRNAGRIMWKVTETQEVWQRGIA